MIKNLKKFGNLLKDLRIKKELSLRQACRLINYDPSNWSKIERGIMSPPSDEKTLQKWAKVLGLAGDKKQFQEFIDEAKITQGIIPQDILSQEEIVECLPAFFRTLRNKKPTKKEINQLIDLIRRQSK
jgi:transcriptional regulator with XRE-family HTH domain